MAGDLEIEVRSIFNLYSDGRFEQGLQRARALHKAAPQLAISNYCVGHGLGAMQRPRDALPFLRKATQIEPRNVEFLARYGRTLLDAGKIREAESALLKAHDLNPRLPIIPWTLGIYYASIDRFDRAVTFFQKVLEGELPPQFRNNAKVDWANALIEVGRSEEAEPVLRELLSDAAGRGAALAKLATIDAFPPGSRELMMLDEELARRDISSIDRSVLLASRARTCASVGDLEGEYDLIRQSKDARGSMNLVDQFGERVDALIAAFTPETMAELSTLAGEQEFQPIYVVGLPRSGTTLTEKILSAHSKVGGAGELLLMEDFSREIQGTKPSSDVLTLVQKTGGSQFRELIGEVVSTMRFLCPGVDRIVDKLPHNFQHCGFIASIFHGARIVHCFRNPADNFLSGFKASLLASHSYFDDPKWFIAYYGHYERLMKHWYECIGDRIYRLHYEDLVTEPQREIGRLLAFCGLEWEDACLHPEENASRIGTASVMQARSPINAKSVGGWRKYSSHLSEIAEKCNESDFLAHA